MTAIVSTAAQQESPKSRVRPRCALIGHAAPGGERGSILTSCARRVFTLGATSGYRGLPLH